MSRRHKVHWLIVLLLVVASMIHQVGPRIIYTRAGTLDVEWRLWEWYIEDSAISFAYARHLAAGEGLVMFPGGERVEGYSNPLWVFLMAAWYLVGVDGFWSSKLMALGFGGCTVILAYKIAREVILDPKSDAPLIAPIALAASAQFAFWNAAGLENPLFCFLMAGALWRTAVEARTGGFPWAAIWYMLLAITRPEAIMYGALGGFWAMVASLSAGRGLKPTIKWLLAFFLPFTIYHAVRYTYFAWAFPNTYYAKLGHREFRPFNWNGRGWKYTRKFAHEVGAGYFIPVYIAGAVTLKAGRKYFAGVVMLLAGIVLLYPGTETAMATSWWPRDLPTPQYWAEIRSYTLLLLAIVVPLGGIGSRGWVPRAVAWGSGCIVVFFCVKSTGDWMKGFRWYNFLTVPASVLFAAGVYEIAGLTERLFSGRSIPLSAPDPKWTTPGWMVATLLAVLVIPPNINHTAWFLGVRETGPFAVKKRVTYTASVADRIYAFGQLRNLDVDQGAHLYWCEHHMVDIAGLVDVAMAHHNFERPFIREYIFEETKPDFAHVHGGWASSSRIPTHPEWKRDYFELPGYPAGKRSFHTGNHLRRDMLMASRWYGPSRRAIPFTDGITLDGFDVPSPEVSEGKSFFLRAGFSYKKVGELADFRVIGFLSNDAGELFTFDIPMGYDWLPPSEWRAEEVFVGRFGPKLPDDLPPGDYDLGFVVLDAEGTVVMPLPELEGTQPFPIPAGAVVGGLNDEPIRFAAGEVRFRNVVLVGPPGTSEKQARLDFQSALDSAAVGKCPEALNDWNNARAHVPNADSWVDERIGEVGTAIAGCHARLAREEDDRAQAVEYLVLAREWDHSEPTLLSVGSDLADVLYEEGMVARQSRDWEVAYRRFADALRADPTRSWARRYAEEARDYRMELDPETKAAEEQEREERLERLRLQRERSAAEREERAAGDEEADVKLGGVESEDRATRVPIRAAPPIGKPPTPRSVGGGEGDDPDDKVDVPVAVPVERRPQGDKP